MPKKTLDDSWIGSFLFALLIVIWYRNAFSYTLNGNELHYDYRLAATVLILGSFFAELCWERVLCPLFEKMDFVSRVDVIFCICVLFFCCLPISRLYFAETSVAENRALARFPAFWTSDGRIYAQFGNDVESWLNDHIAGRRKLLSVYQCIERFISPDRIETDRAFTGQNDWLFYTNVADGNPVALFQNRLPFANLQLIDIKETLIQQTAWLGSHGISYIVFVAPNKADIYGEYYPKGIQKVSPMDRVSLLRDYLKYESETVLFLYPLEDLLAHKKDGLLYYKNDTHWSPFGAYWGYRSLMDEVKKLLPDIEVLTLESLDLNESVHAGGDLNNMLPSVSLAPYQDVFYLTPALPNGPRYKEDILVKEPREGYHRIHTINPYGKYKAVVFRDSFSDSLIPYLSESFYEVLYISAHDLNPYADLIEKEKPDIVIHEMVSRAAGVLTIKTPYLSLEGEGKR